MKCTGYKLWNVTVRTLTGKKAKFSKQQKRCNGKTQMQCQGGNSVIQFTSEKLHSSITILPKKVAILKCKTIKPREEIEMASLLKEVVNSQMTRNTVNCFVRGRIELGCAVPSSLL